MQGRIEELADKSTEGTLTPEERDEYEALIRVDMRWRKPAYCYRAKLTAFLSGQYCRPL